MKLSSISLLTFLFFLPTLTSAQKVKSPANPAVEVGTVTTPPTERARRAHTVSSPAASREATLLKRKVPVTNSRSPEELNNWGAPKGIVSSTKKFPSGGRPTTRSYASIGLGAGQSAAETLTEMHRGYPNLTMYDYISAMIRGGYPINEVYASLLSFDYENGEVASTLRTAGATAGAVGLAIKKETKLNTSSVFTILVAGGFTTEEIVKGAEEEMKMPAGLLFKSLKSVRVNMPEASMMVQHEYRLTEMETITLAKQNGVSTEELFNTILVNMDVAMREAPFLLKAAGVADLRIIETLKNKYRASMNTAGQILKNELRAERKEAIRILRTVYGGSEFWASMALDSKSGS